MPDHVNRTALVQNADKFNRLLRVARSDLMRSKEMTFQQQRDSIIWAVTNEGELIGLTYEREQSVVGWHRHTTGGTFESVATIYGEDEEDEVWVIVKRTINGSTVRFIELWVAR